MGPRTNTKLSRIKLMASRKMHWLLGACCEKHGTPCLKSNVAVRLVQERKFSSHPRERDASPHQDMSVAFAPPSANAPLPTCVLFQPGCELEPENLTLAGDTRGYHFSGFARSSSVNCACLGLQDLAWSA